MLTEQRSFHMLPVRLPALVLLLVLGVGEAGAQQDSDPAQGEEPETGQAASQADGEQGTEGREFEPSEKISADDAVSFPVDI